LYGCAREFIDHEISEACYYASMCGKGDWPIAGGLLDQSYWFVQLKAFRQGELNQIENERHKAD